MGLDPLINSKAGSAHAQLACKHIQQAAQGSTRVWPTKHTAKISQDLDAGDEPGGLPSWSARGWPEKVDMRFTRCRLLADGDILIITCHTLAGLPS